MTPPRPNYQRSPSSPGPDSDPNIRKKLAHTERELAIARRYLHKVQREHGLIPTKFFSMPRYGKLKYRPVLLGFAPSSGARSGLPFDDEFGDHMCEVFGLLGYQHLLVNMKVRNVFLNPADDLPHQQRGRVAMDGAMTMHVRSGLFAGRVVLVVGKDARRAAGIEVPHDYIGPVDAPRLGDAAIVLTLPDIGHPKQWPRERRETLWGCLAFAMAASRLPSATPIPDAVALAGGAVDRKQGAVPAYDSLYHPHLWAPFPDPKNIERGADLWLGLIARGLAAPPNLTRGAWLPTAQASVLYTTGGMAHIQRSREPDIRELIVNDYSRDGDIVLRRSGKAGDMRRIAEEYMLETRKWDHPFRALDARLEEMRR